MSKQLQTNFVALQKKNGAKSHTVADLFANPPSWLPGQLALYRADPERYIKPLCKAVAAVVLGDDAHWEEVRAEVERILKEGTQG